MNIEKVKEIQKFYRVTGALDELSERQLVHLDTLNTEEHKKYLEDLLKKFDISYDSVDGGLYDEISNMEIILDEKFTEIMERI